MLEMIKIAANEGGGGEAGHDLALAMHDHDYQEIPEALP